MQAQRSEYKLYNAYKNCFVCSVAPTYNSCMGMQKQDVLWCLFSSNPNVICELQIQLEVLSL